MSEEEFRTSALLSFPMCLAYNGNCGRYSPRIRSKSRLQALPLILKGEVANEVIYDKVLEITRTYLPTRQQTAETATPGTSQSVNVNTRTQARLPQTGTAFAGGGQLAFLPESALTDTNRWSDKRQLPGIVDLLVIREARQVQLDVIVAEISLTRLRELGVDIGVVGKHTSFLSRAGTQGGFSCWPAV